MTTEDKSNADLYYADQLKNMVENNRLSDTDKLKTFDTEQKITQTASMISRTFSTSGIEGVNKISEAKEFLMSQQGILATAGVAAKNSQTDLLKHLNENYNFSLSSTFKEGRTLAHIVALNNKNPDVLIFLKNSGASINAEDNYRITPFDLIGGDIELLKLFYDEGIYEENKLKQTNEKSFAYKRAKAGNYPSLVYLHEKNENLTVFPDGTDTPLHGAALGGEMKTIQFLESIGANFYQKNSSGMSAIDIATSRNDKPQIYYYQTHGYDTHQNELNQLLFEKTTVSDLPRIISLVEKGADIQATDYRDKSLFEHAINSGKIEILKYFDELAPDSFSSGELGEFFCRAIKNNDFEIMKFLHKIGADIHTWEMHDVRDNIESETNIFIIAIKNENVEIFKYLYELEGGKDRRHLIFEACYEGADEIVEYLIKLDPRTLNERRDFKYIAETIVANDLLKSLIVLHEIGTNLSELPHAAAKNGAVNCLKYLYENNIPMFEKDNKGKTPLENAIEMKKDSAVEFYQSMQVKQSIHNLLDENTQTHKTNLRKNRNIF
jgi:ankyrin repeat protein